MTANPALFRFPSLARSAASLGRIGGTAWLEVRLNVLSPAPWVVGLALAIFGYLAVRTAADDSSFALAWTLSQQIGPLSEVLLLFLAASLAHRPQRYGVTELQDSKLVAPEEISLGRWLGLVATILLPLALQYGTTMTAQLIHSPMPLQPLAYGQSLARLLPSVLFLTTLSFCLVALTRVLILGAGLAGLVWFVLFFGQSYYPSVFRIELSQNRLVFVGLATGVFLLMLLGYQGRRRAKRASMSYALAGAASLVFAATLLHAAWVSLALPGKSAALASWKRLQEAGRRPDDPLPNFAWNDVRGRRVSLASLRGKPVLLVFFSPRDRELVPLLTRLAGLRREFPSARLGLLAICLAEDLNGAADAAHLAGPRLPDDFFIVTDWGGATLGGFDEQRPSSVASWALKVPGTPAAIFIDAGGREQTRDLPLDEANWPDFKERLQAALRGESAETAAPGLLPGGGL